VVQGGGGWRGGGSVEIAVLQAGQGSKGGSRVTGFQSFMEIALEEARAAGDRGEVPVGAVIVFQGQVVARAGNRTREMCDPTAHAEVLAIRAACAAAGSERLVGHDLYVTLEPCAMCAGAIAAARVARLYYGAGDPKSGGVAQGARVFGHPQCHHVPEVYDGIGGAEAEALLRAFFAGRRREN
jgi:tRNA(adenine34) deaminase